MKRNPEESEEISCRELESWLQEEATPLLIDCREMDEWNYNRIEGATHIPLGLLMEKTAFAADRPIVVYCHHGVRSLYATRHLRRCGARGCFSLAGGIHVWSLQVDSSVPIY